MYQHQDLPPPSGSARCPRLPYPASFRLSLPRARLLRSQGRCLVLVCPVSPSLVLGILEADALALVADRLELDVAPLVAAPHPAGLAHQADDRLLLVPALVRGHVGQV